MEENKNLKLARQARLENNIEDAKLFYSKAREELPDNGEAKYFYAYYSLYEGKTGEIPVRFSSLCKSVLPSVNMVRESSLSKEEQLVSIGEIVNCFVPEAWVIHKYMNRKNTETRVGNEFVTVFERSTLEAVGKAGLTTLKKLGDTLESLYINDPECKKLASIAWKEYVSLSQKWFPWAVKGDAVIYAEKIKRVDPSYEMPKKAGCITNLISPNTKK